MLHFVGRKGSGGGGGGSGGATVIFNPNGGTFPGTSISVSIVVTGAPKLRWKINAGAYTSINATSTSVSVPLTLAGNTLTADALSATGAVLATRSAFFGKQDGGQ